MARGIAALGAACALGAGGGAKEVLAELSSLPQAVKSNDNAIGAKNGVSLVLCCAVLCCAVLCCAVL